jgi:hypothetical protein
MAADIADTPRKVMDVSRLTAMGWAAWTPFDQVMTATHAQYTAAIR